MSIIRPLAAVAALTLVACSRSLAPYDVIELRTEVAPAAFAVGDTVMIRAIMRNPTSTVIEPGRACGPPVLFEFRNGSGAVVHPIALDGIFTCPGLDYHVLEPFETDTVVVRWRVELTPGPWSVRSGFRAGSKLDRLSPPVGVVVGTSE